MNIPVLTSSNPLTRPGYVPIQPPILAQIDAESAAVLAAITTSQTSALSAISAALTSALASIAAALTAALASVNSAVATAVAALLAGNKFLESDSTTTKRMYRELLIGAWNMSFATGTSTVDVPHTITKWKTIRVHNVTIRDDADAFYSQLIAPGLNVGVSAMGGNVEFQNSTVIRLDRGPNGSLFDNANYDSVGGGFNRGFVMISYEP